MERWSSSRDARTAEKEAAPNAQRADEPRRHSETTTASARARAAHARTSTRVASGRRCTWRSRRMRGDRKTPVAAFATVGILFYLFRPEDGRVESFDPSSDALARAATDVDAFADDDFLTLLREAALAGGLKVDCESALLACPARFSRAALDVRPDRRNLTAFQIYRETFTGRGRRTTAPRPDPDRVDAARRRAQSANRVRGHRRYSEKVSAATCQRAPKSWNHTCALTSPRAASPAMDASSTKTSATRPPSLRRRPAKVAGRTVEAAPDALAPAGEDDVRCSARARVAAVVERDASSDTRVSRSTPLRCARTVPLRVSRRPPMASQRRESSRARRGTP